MTLKKNREAKQIFLKLSKKKPAAMKGFMDFIKGIDDNGALSAKMKQIISIALSIQSQCEWCMSYHTVKALDLGATEEEITDACFVAAFFGGGPAMMHAKIIFDTIDEYKEKLKKKEERMQKKEIKA
ncbi:MAG: carboxymuconolactone decarboxylase family protein [Promethearchaeota archaeon]